MGHGCLDQNEPVAGDQTQQQSLGEQLSAERLSLQSTVPPAILPGYRLERFLGAGTFGQVWYGHSLNTGRPVAIKFYLHRGGVNWSLLAREVKNLVQLSADRSIVQVLDVGWDSEPPYYVMEYLSNGSLEDLLRRRGRLPVPQAVEMFRRICLGLNHCHGKGVLHCDLKPANVLLDDDQNPRLADFGQSRMSHDQTPSLGTLFYMAPEQANLEAIPDARWDVYALGVILYRMLTGKVPHRDEPLVRQIDTAGSLPRRLQHYREAIIKDGAPTSHRTRRGVDRSLGLIVDRCLAPDANQRFANVQQVLASLDRRDEIKARRPLMLLGIVGPLLLLLATFVFAARSVSGASRNVTEALRTEARGSNALAARFAARTLENELQRYFQAVDRETLHGETRRELANVIRSPELSSLRIELATRRPGEEGRLRFLRHPDRVAFDRLLQERLARYAKSASNARPAIATMFITDALGTIVAIAYDESVSDEQNSLGRNFAYRTYFHGGQHELPRSTAVDSIRPLIRPHLSSAFQSTATNQWKVAFSAPIFLDAADGVGPPEVAGVFVATTNLGDFELMRAADNGGQLAVVIDAREGELRGTVLQHPLMDLQQADSTVELNRRYQVDSEVLDRLIAGQDVDYDDPLATAPDGGEAYSGGWLAAVAPVALPESVRDDGTETLPKPGTTDLLVLVQYRLSKVFEPVGEMKRQLLVEGTLAGLTIVLIIFLMWYYVNRISDQPVTDDGPADVASPGHAVTEDHSK